jgi:hypothetical protein
MGYCVSELRRLALIEGPARFAAQIDDGLLRISLNRAKFTENAEASLKLIEKIYSAAGMYISWDKTFVSKSICVFLNDVRYMGRTIAPGLRAVLKISDRADCVVPSLADDLNNLESTCRGAVAAGCSLMSVYGIYTLRLYDTFLRWSNQNCVFRPSFALALFAPRELGGFGICSPMHLAGSIAYVKFNDCIGSLELIGIRYSAVRDGVNKFLSCKLKQASENFNVFNPLKVRVDGMYLREDRAVKTIAKALIRKSNSPVLTRLLEGVSAFDAYGARIFRDAGSRFPIEITDSFLGADPKCIIEQIAKKFLRSRTAGFICPKRALIRVQIANIVEAKNLITAYAYA